MSQYCAFCGIPIFNHIITTGYDHHSWCIYHSTYIVPDYGQCEVCNIHLDDCSWAYWIKDRKLCRLHSDDPHSPTS